MIPFPVEHALSLPPNFWRFVVKHDRNTWADHATETGDHVNIDEFELDLFFCLFFVGNVFLELGFETRVFGGALKERDKIQDFDQPVTTEQT